VSIALNKKRGGGRGKSHKKGTEKKKKARSRGAYRLKEKTILCNQREISLTVQWGGCQKKKDGKIAGGCISVHKKLKRNYKGPSGGFRGRRGKTQEMTKKIPKTGDQKINSFLRGGRGPRGGENC